MMLMPILEYHQQHDEANKEIEVDSWSFGRDLMTKLTSWGGPEKNSGNLILILQFQA